MELAINAADASIAKLIVAKNSPKETKWLNIKE